MYQPSLNILLKNDRNLWDRFFVKQVFCPLKILSIYFLGGKAILEGKIYIPKDILDKIWMSISEENEKKI